MRASHRAEAAVIYPSFCVADARAGGDQRRSRRGNTARPGSAAKPTPRTLWDRKFSESQAATDFMSFLFEFNGVPMGMTDLVADPDALSQVAVTEKPKH